MNNQTSRGAGVVVRVAGPVVEATGLDGVRLYDLVRVGQQELVGEVIRLDEETATIQVYEETSGVRSGEPVTNTGAPLVAWLGPGLLGQTYDGLQRPLDRIAETTGAMVERGVDVPPLSTDRRWPFEPVATVGQEVSPGMVLGTVPEVKHIVHRVLVPPGTSGRIAHIEAGEFAVDETVATVNIGDGSQELTMMQRWPVRTPRPVARLLPPREPLVTGTRVVDAFFPVAKGGAVIVPGGFGTGKTVLEQQLARWSDADVVIYVGCGERGNEMAEVLEEFPEITDPHTGQPLMNRTILIANTSNMPVAARESSIYTGVTLAEYYRDMGYDVLLLADSTSRWGEALREISARLEEIPGEKGYPAYLAARVAGFYERAGRAVCLGGEADTDNASRRGSVTLAGAVSPPGGDFSEPITQNSMRVTGTLWALDYDLSRRRHFPAISWTQSYTLYELADWYEAQVGKDWQSLTGEALRLLQNAGELEEIVRLVGPEGLPESDRLVLRSAAMLREDFLQQSAFDEIDRYSPLAKTYWMLKALVTFHKQADYALEEESLETIMKLDVVDELARMKRTPGDEVGEALPALIDRIESSLGSLDAEGEHDG